MFPSFSHCRTTCHYTGQDSAAGGAALLDKSCGRVVSWDAFTEDSWGNQRLDATDTGVAAHLLF